MPPCTSTCRVVLPTGPHAATACFDVTVELEGGTALSTLACAGGESSAAFALPLFLPAGGGSQLGRVLITQPAASGSPARLWQQLITARGSVELRADMRQAVEQAAAAAVPAPTSAAAAAGSPACRQLAYAHLEDAGDRSLPTYLALAGPAPTCPLPQLGAAQAGPGQLSAAAHRAPSSQLSWGLGATCAVQAALLAVLLLKRRAPQGAEGSEDGGAQTAAQAAAPVPRRLSFGAARSLRDACTSPLLLLSSPLRGRAGAGAELASIPEDGEEGEEEAAAAAAAAAGQEEKGGSGGDLTPEARRSGFLGLPAPPQGWTRCAAVVPGQPARLWVDRHKLRCAAVAACAARAGNRLPGPWLTPPSCRTSLNHARVPQRRLGPPAALLWAGAGRQASNGRC